MERTIAFQEFKLSFRQIVEMLFMPSFRNIKHKVIISHKADGSMAHMWSKFGSYNSFDLISQKKCNRSSFITEFTVVEPQNELETKGEIFTLSTFGEYCPKRSMRGYSLSYLLSKPHCYHPTKIVEQDRVINMKKKSYEFKISEKWWDDVRSLEELCQLSTYAFLFWNKDKNELAPNGNGRPHIVLKTLENKIEYVTIKNIGGLTVNAEGTMGKAFLEACKADYDMFLHKDPRVVIAKYLELIGEEEIIIGKANQDKS